MLGKQHGSLAFLCEGNVSKNVNLASLEPLEKIRPGALDVLYLPVGVSDELLLVLVGIALASAVLVDVVEGGIEPANAHQLLLIGMGRTGSDQAEKAKKNQEHRTKGANGGAHKLPKAADGNHGSLSMREAERPSRGRSAAPATILNSHMNFT